jgi:hypothetical protein
MKKTKNQITKKRERGNESSISILAAVELPLNKAQSFESSLNSLGLVWI